jgi:hypothetical protein
MPIASREQFRRAYPQVPAGAQNDILIDEYLARAEAMITEYIGLSYEGYTPGTETVMNYGSEWLLLPAHQRGSITQIATEGGVVIPTSVWVEDMDGNVYLKSGLGYYASAYSAGYIWAPGRYVVTANWGWGEVPADLELACLEITMNLWQEKNKGSHSDVVGVEGSGGELRVGYQKGITNRQRMILDLHRQKALDLKPLALG